MRVIALLSMLVVGIVQASGAQELRIEDFEPILLPTAAGIPRPGAHGSLWQTEFVVRNDSTEAVIFGQGEPICRLSTCDSPYTQIAPMTTETWPAGTLAPIPYLGLLFYVERSGAAAVTMNLRLRETSRNQSGAGTNVPIIRESELRSGKIQLLNVPIDAMQRINLRVFEVDRSGSPEAIVRIFAGNNLVWSERRILFVPQTGPFAEYPAEDVLFNVEKLIPAQACCAPLRIEVEPLRPGRYWAYATLINNATQEVLLITPE